MSNFKGFLIILSVYIFGDFIQNLFGLSIPAPVIGIFLLTALLLTGIVKLEDVEDASDNMRAMLGLLFVPVITSSIGMIGILKGNFIKVTAVYLITTVLTIVAVLLVTDKATVLRGEEDE